MRREPVKNLIDYKPCMLEKCCILLFGLSGVGKTSTVNTLSSTEEDVHRVASDQRYHERNRIERNIFTFNDNVSVGKMDYEAATNNGQLQNFRSILVGDHVVDHIDRDFIPSQSSTAPPPEVENRFQAIVFVIEAGDYNLQGLRRMKDMHTFVKVEDRIPAIVAVTKIELWFEAEFGERLLLEKERKHAYMKVICSEKWRALVERIQMTLRDEECIVLPIINYAYSDCYTNPIICLFAENFVFAMTRYIDDFYEKRHICHHPCVYHPQPLQPKSSHFFFKNETPVILGFDQSLCRSQDYSKKQEEDGEEEEEEEEENRGFFLILDSFYKCLKIGNEKWRFFSLVIQKDRDSKTIIGMFNPDKEVYFEYQGEFMSTGDLLISFDERNLQKYSFVNNEAVGMVELSRISVFLILTIATGDRSILLKRVEEVSGKHSYMINYIQQKKEMEFMYKEREDRRNEEINQLKLEWNRTRKDDLKMMKEFIMKMSRSVQRIENGKEEAHEPQQQGTSSSY